MNAAQIHLALTHLPVFGYVLFTPLFLFALWKKKDDLVRICAVFFVILSVAAIVVFNSGEGAEEIIELTTEIGHDVIHEHEESGEKSFWLLSISGLAGALVLALRISTKPVKQYRLLLVMGLLLIATSFSSLYTAHLGGQIRHPEMELGGSDTPNVEIEDEADDD